MINKLVLILKKKSVLFTTILLLAVFMGIFQFFMNKTVSDLQGKNRLEYIINPKEVYEVPIEEGGYTQEFYHDGKIYSIGLIVNSFTNTGSLKCNLYNSSDNLIAFSETLIIDIVDGIIIFKFIDPIILSSDRYLLEIIPKNNDTIVTKAGKITNENNESQTAIALLAQVEVLGSFITNFYRALSVFVSLTIALIYFLSQGNISIHKLYMITAVLLGLLFSTVLPPYSAPDEQFHINESFTISSSLLKSIPDEYQELSKTGKSKVNIKRADDYNEVLQDRYTTAFSYKALLSNIFSTSKDNTPAVFEGDQVGGYKLLYIPAVIGVTIARIFNLGFNIALVLGRLFTLGSYIALTTLAVKFTPIKKSLFAVIGLLPMSMHLASSFSRDALTISLYMFFTAYYLYLDLEKEAITLKDIVIILAVSLFAFPAKIVYAPLILMLLFLPNNKFKIQEKVLSEKIIKTIKILICTLGVTLFLVFIYPTIVSEFVWNHSSGSTDPDSIRYNAGYILSHLKDTAFITLNTIFTNTTFYLNSLVGGSLGYYSIDIDWIFIVAIYMLLIYALIPNTNDRYTIKKRTSIAGVVLTTISALLVVLACIGWTPTYYLTIYGIQGRYFLPLIPLLLCSIFTGSKSKIQKIKDTDKTTIFVAFLLSVCVALNAFLIILER